MNYNKCYLVMYYEGDICGVFSTLEKAQKEYMYLKSINIDTYIEEIDFDVFSKQEIELMKIFKPNFMLGGK